jgi:hypothetical protein
MSTLKNDLLNWPIEFLQFVPLEEACRLSSLSEDTLRRHHSDKIVSLAPRRSAMRRGHALMLTTPIENA